LARTLEEDYRLCLRKKPPLSLYLEKEERIVSANSEGHFTGGGRKRSPSSISERKKERGASSLYSSCKGKLAFLLCQKK